MSRLKTTIRLFPIFCARICRIVPTLILRPIKLGKLSLRFVIITFFMAQQNPFLVLSQHGQGRRNLQAHNNIQMDFGRLHNSHPIYLATVPDMEDGLAGIQEIRLNQP